jgi:ParB family chromosome partitioning protein
MTSARFSPVRISDITIDRETRQRKQLKGIDELAESISRLGLINPIVIDSEFNLVAGERRLTACTALGWDQIPAQFADDLDEYTLQCIEFEENAKRTDLTWQEEVAALARLHQLKVENEPDWSATDTADFIGFSPSYVKQRLQVAKAIDSPPVANAETFSTALNITKRDAERKQSSAMLEATSKISTLLQPTHHPDEDIVFDEYWDKKAAPPPPIPLINTSFIDWQSTYTGPKFNLIHCDFPYGINVADAPRMGAGMADHYEDSPDIYWALVAALGRAMENVVAESAHLIFWLSPKFYADTRVALERMGWKLFDYPLIWHKSDGAGIAPDPQRGPRNTYELAFFGLRGDRKLTAAGTKANSFAFPGKRDGAIHVSEKPYPMLKHFLAMICDDYSHVLDPTCGSGNALKVAEDLGAARVLGIEQIKEFYDISCAAWEKRE